MTTNALPQSTNSDSQERARLLYWEELVQLRTAALYIQLYRARITAVLLWIDIARAIVSVTALGSWVGGFGYPKVWAAVIVMSQVAEAVLAKMPLAVRLKGLSGFTSALDTMAIDALLEWEHIQTDQAGDAKSVTKRWHSLMKARKTSEEKHLPSGLPVKAKLFQKAEVQAKDFFGKFAI